MKTTRLTMAQALIQFLQNQYVERDGQENPFFAGCWASSVMVTSLEWDRLCSSIRYFSATTSVATNRPWYIQRQPTPK